LGLRREGSTEGLEEVGEELERQVEGCRRLGGPGEARQGGQDVGVVRRIGDSSFRLDRRE
jgi:hypothetical protein